MPPNWVMRGDEGWWPASPFDPDFQTGQPLTAGGTGRGLVLGAEHGHPCLVLAGQGLQERVPHDPVERVQSRHVAREAVVLHRPAVLLLVASDDGEVAVFQQGRAMLGLAGSQVAATV